LKYIVSVDLGTMNDFTAISILDELYRPRVKQTAADVRRGLEGTVYNERIYALRHLQRIKLKTSYVDIVATIAGLMNSSPLRGDCELVVDSTGVGRPVVDMLLKEHLNPVAVTITGGKSVSNPAGSEYHVPKRDLATSLQVAFASKRLSIVSGLSLTNDFLREVENFKIKISIGGSETYEAWREKDHDDLVLSVAMGVWWAFFSRCQDVKIKPPHQDKTEFDPLRYEL